MFRTTENPILNRFDIPDLGPHIRDVSSVFNPAAIKLGDVYHLMLRVQNRGRETYLMIADSNDGVNFSVRDNLVNFNGIEKIKDTVYHVYDPRITKIGNNIYVIFAMDMAQGCVLGLAQSNDLKSFQFLGIISDNNNRNGVLFPEKYNGSYIRLDRPNQQFNSNVKSGSKICLSSSENLLKWNHVSTVMVGRDHYWDELIGAGPPPVKTESGWLLIYHGVALHFQSSNIYQVGVALLDLKEPSKLISRSKYNILEPRESYELTGQVPNVIFPSGMIVENYDESGFAKLNSEVKIYYGAADTCIGLAESTIGELISMAKNE